ncbi:MAG: alpha/beta fold hydrolase [Gallionella sp.]
MNIANLNHDTHKHDRTITSSTTYWLTKAAFHIAPNKTAKLMREKGFRVRQYPLSADQHALMQQARSFHLEFNGNAIKVFEWGDGPVVLLVHGWAGRALQFDALIRSLLTKGYRVVAFDHKGHGESSTRFSSFPEIVRSTELVATHYGEDLYGVVAHSMGSNSIFKVCEKIEQKLKVAVIAPVGNFMDMLERLRRRMGIYEKLYMRVINEIESENGLQLADLSELDYGKINRHDILLVHDKFDRINKVTVSLDLHANLQGSVLLQTEMLGHSRILGNQEVIAKVITHLEPAGADFIPH